MANLRTITVDNVTYDVADAWFGTTATVTNGAITFTGIDDTHGYAYDKPYIDVTSASSNKAPYTELTSISGEGTNNMTLVYATDADEGASAKLRIIK